MAATCFQRARWFGASLAGAALLASLARPAAAEDAAREALALCQTVAGLDDAERSAQLEEGLALAERALAERPDDPIAHFAAFCNRARRLQDEGVSLRVFAEIRRVRRDIDRALELQPDWADAVAAKGAMLLALPRPLGGDRGEGERLLRQALALDPSNPEVRRLLDEAGLDAPPAGPVARAAVD